MGGKRRRSGRARHKWKKGRETEGGREEERGEEGRRGKRGGDARQGMAQEESEQEGRWFELEQGVGSGDGSTAGRIERGMDGNKQRAGRWDRRRERKLEPPAGRIHRWPTSRGIPPAMRMASRLASVRARNPRARAACAVSSGLDDAGERMLALSRVTNVLMPPEARTTSLCKQACHTSRGQEEGDKHGGKERGFARKEHQRSWGTDTEAREGYGAKVQTPLHSAPVGAVVGKQVDEGADPMKLLARRGSRVTEDLGTEKRFWWLSRGGEGGGSMLGEETAPTHLPTQVNRARDREGAGRQRTSDERGRGQGRESDERMGAEKEGRGAKGGGRGTSRGDRGRRPRSPTSTSLTTPPRSRTISWLRVDVTMLRMARITSTSRSSLPGWR